LEVLVVAEEVVDHLEEVAVGHFLEVEGGCLR